MKRIDNNRCFRRVLFSRWRHKKWNQVEFQNVQKNFIQRFWIEQSMSSVFSSAFYQESCETRVNFWFRECVLPFKSLKKVISHKFGTIFHETMTMFSKIRAQTITPFFKRKYMHHPNEGAPLDPRKKVEAFAGNFLDFHSIVYILIVENW